MSLVATGRLVRLGGVEVARRARVEMDDQARRVTVVHNVGGVDHTIVYEGADLQSRRLATGVALYCWEDQMLEITKLERCNCG